MTTSGKKVYIGGGGLTRGQVAQAIMQAAGELGISVAVYDDGMQTAPAVALGPEETKALSDTNSMRRAEDKRQRKARRRIKNEQSRTGGNTEGVR